MTCGNCKNGECQTPYSCHVPVNDKIAGCRPISLIIAGFIIAGMVLLAMWMG